MSELRVLVVADDPLSRAGLAALVASQPGVAVIGQMPGSELAAMLDVYRPDAVVWDIGWEAAPPSLAAIRHILEDAESHPPVIALLPESSIAAELWATGARGLLPRSVAGEQLAAALAAISGGLIVADPAFGAALLAAPHLSPDGAEIGEDLTPRELEVLRLLAEGLANKAIALRLGITEHTVKFHLTSLMGKLGAQSRTDVVVRATRRGLLTL